MPIVAREGEVFKQPPPGIHHAIAIDVVDLGIVESNYSGNIKKQHKISVVWELDLKIKDDEEGRNYKTSKWYTLSLNEKSNLRKDLESWRGRPFTSQELVGFDVERLLNVQCQLQIMQRPDNPEKTFVNMVLPPVSKHFNATPGYIRRQDRPQENGNQGSPQQGNPQGQPDTGPGTQPGAESSYVHDDIPF